jgi:glutamate racemase
VSNSQSNHVGNDAPVGVFDSGLGGLCVLREIRHRAPAERLLYLADHAHFPYGTRPLAEVRKFATQITRRLRAEGVKLITIACNTASAAALHRLREAYPDTPFVGMEPAVKPAVRSTGTGTVGVLATEATFQGELFASLLERFARDATVITQACPGLVELVEKGECNSARARALLLRYVQPLLERGTDTLVLGCTHYSFLKKQLQHVAGLGVTIIDPAPAVAEQVIRVLSANGLARSTPTETAAPIVVCTTDRALEARFSAQAHALLDEPVLVRSVK